MSKKFFRDVDTVAEKRKALRQTSELAQDEIVLWRGRPKRGIAFVGYDLLTIPFTLMWFYVVSSVHWRPGRRGQFDILDIGLFPAVGFYIAFGRFLTDALYRSRLSYVITNQRVIIDNGLPRGGVMSIDHRALKLRLEERRDGSGTIQLEHTDMWSTLSYFPMHACWWRRPHLFRIKDARQVFELLRRQGAS